MDIFKARETLGGHLCIMGDVPASLFAFGQPEQAAAYSDRVLDVMGTDAASSWVPAARFRPTHSGKT